MKPLDWLVLGGWLAFIVGYGIWRGRGSRDLSGYILANRDMPWPTIALSVMATQASAITFLSTPGQAFVDGMRFVQFYFGLPIAMVVLCATAIPIYRRWNVFTAYEYLEDRFDVKTRSLAAFLFLIQRGLSAGLTIYAPALILSVLLGWDLHLTILMMGGLVVIYTAFGGARAVSHTQFLQIQIMIAGFVIAGVIAFASLPPGVTFGDALTVAGAAGRLNAVDLSFDPNNRYNLWSGLIGGFFLQLSYFGADQSQVGRYLTAKSVTQSRLGLLFNGVAKVPMQFAILMVGVMVFVFYQFALPPLSFNPVDARAAATGPHAREFRALEAREHAAFDIRLRDVRALIDASRAHDAPRIDAAKQALRASNARLAEVRARGADVIRRTNPTSNGSDTNYIFLGFVLAHFPAGVIGLVLAAAFAAAMSSSSAELSSLASTSVVDVARRLLHLGGEGRADLWLSRAATVFWAAIAVGFAEFANRLGSLVEAVNILGSLFYGTILGIFLAGFYVRRIGGTAVFAAALIAEAIVIACFRYTHISFLWYNAIGCLLVVGIGLALSAVLPRRQSHAPGGA